MNVGILGSGTVAQALAAGFLVHGHSVLLGTRDPARLEAWAAAHEGAATGSVAEAAAHGALLVLAGRGTAAEQVLAAAGSAVDGKVVIDTTNPLADEAPDAGVLHYFTGPNESLLERLQARFPSARLVKAFNSVGNQHMVAPDFGGTRPTMFICGDDDAAKEQVTGILQDFGWDVADMGARQAARAIEPLCMLWCIPGLREGRWDHAFALIRK
jgi:8-hydroxy-5-deazaflavin:NADPH oxidoreductase